MNETNTLSEEEVINKKTLDILRSEIQTKFQAEVSVKRHYISLVQKINEKIKDMGISVKAEEVPDISFHTIGRIWGYIDKTNMNKVKGRESNLSLLAEILEYDGWLDFCKKHSALEDLEYVYPDYVVDTLDVGENITIGTINHKYSILKKLNDGEFEVVEEKNMSNKKGSILYIEKIVLEPGTTKSNAFPEIKYIHLPNYEDEDGNGDIKASLLEPRLL